MKKINTALLSYGMSGKVFHAPFIHLHPGFHLLGAWERSKKLIKEDYPSVRSYDSIDELLRDTVDMVVVNTPVDTHYEYTKKVLEAGKHALVEKAFTATAAQAKELKALAESKGLNLCVYQNRRWDSDFLTVKQVVEQGLLGDIVEAEFRFDRYNPMLSPKQHKETGTKGSGVLRDLGAHIIDQALYMFGFPKAVFADIRVLRENSVVGDDFSVILYYDDKRVKLHSGFFVCEAVPAYAVHGRNGSFLKQRGDVQENMLKAGYIPDTPDWGSETSDMEGILSYMKDGERQRKKVRTLRGNYYHLYEALYDALANGGRIPVPAADGVQTMRIIDAAEESSATKKVIQLN